MTFDLEKRARELWGGAVVSFPTSATVEIGRQALDAVMLMLAHEAADARSEEIAQALLCTQLVGSLPEDLTTARRDSKANAARIARSFIKKPEPALHDCLVPPGLDPEPVETWDAAAGRMLGRELGTVPCTRIKPIDIAAHAKLEAAIRADEREKIIRDLDKLRNAVLDSDKQAGRSLVAGLTAARVAVLDLGRKPEPPKTREAVLEQALKEIEPISLNECDEDELVRKRDIARRALEWKP